MKIILNADIDNLGRRGDVVDVARGYARNYLLPKNLAINATKGALLQAEAMVKAREEQDRLEREAVSGLAQKIAGTRLTTTARVGDEGQLFGSVTNVDVAKLLTEAVGEEIDRRKVELQAPIKNLGTHTFKVHLHRDVMPEATIEVMPDPESVARMAKAAEAKSSEATKQEEAAGASSDPEAAAEPSEAASEEPVSEPAE